MQRTSAPIAIALCTLASAISTQAAPSVSATVKFSGGYITTSYDAYSIRYGGYATWGGHGYGGYRPYWSPTWYHTTRPYPASLYVDTQTLLALADRVDPQLLVDEQRPEPEPQPAAEVPLDQRAADALRNNDYDNAAMLYQRLADNAATDREAAAALRAAAVALTGADRLEEAAARFSEAVKRDDSLMRSPIGPGLVGGRQELSRLSTATLRHARSAGTSDAWIFAGVLLSASGDREAARDAFLTAR